jgi:hypothetical protein
MRGKIERIIINVLLTCFQWLVFYLFIVLLPNLLTEFIKVIAHTSCTCTNLDIYVLFLFLWSNWHLGTLPTTTCYYWYQATMISSIRRAWKYQRNNQNPYIEGQTCLYIHIDSAYILHAVSINIPNI